MVGVEGRNLVISGEAPSSIFNSVPQIACANLMMYIQKEWHFLQCVTPVVGDLFAPLEAELRDDFLPSLVGVRRLSHILLGNYPSKSPGMKNFLVWTKERQGIQEFPHYPSIYILLLCAPTYHMVKKQ